MGSPKPWEMSNRRLGAWCSLLTDDALFDRMCSAARDSAVGRFATSRIIPQYESYYEDVLR